MKRKSVGSLDDVLVGWDAGLKALISKLNAWKKNCPTIEPGWDDATDAARRLIGDARTQKGFLADALRAAKGRTPR